MRHYRIAIFTGNQSYSFLYTSTAQEDLPWMNVRCARVLPENCGTGICALGLTKALDSIGSSGHGIVVI